MTFDNLLGVSDTSIDFGSVLFKAKSKSKNKSGSSKFLRFNQGHNGLVVASALFDALAIAVIMAIVSWGFVWAMSIQIAIVLYLWFYFKHNK